MNNSANSLPILDLVIITDTSPSMKDEVGVLSSLISVYTPTIKTLLPVDAF